MNETLRVVATIPIKTERVEEARAALLDLARTSLEAEEGCLAYAVFESASTPGTFVTIEEWRNQPDLDAHMGTPHVGAAFSALGEAIDGEVGIHPLTPLS